MTPKPLSARTVDRFLELVAIGLTYAEACGAVKIGTTTGDRLMAKPVNRERVDRMRNTGPSTAVVVTAIIDGMLHAKNHDGTPNHPVRQKGVELRLKHAKEYDALTAGEDDGAEDLPEGVILLYPLPKEET